MKPISSFALTLVAFASATIIVGCGGSSSTVSQIAVSVSGASTSVLATQAAPFTATVNGDTSGRGVTWSVSCSATQCGSVSPTSGVATTYTAPGTPPASDLTVTVKATSVADTSKSASATIIVSAISLSVSPATATVQVGAGNGVQMNAIVNNDPSNQGVSWTILPASQAGNLNIQDAFNANYTAPTTPPASDLTVTVTATSKTDSTKSATVTITVPFVTISVTPSSIDSLEAGGNVPNIVATVGNDPGNKGVSWSVSCSPGPCGSVSPSPTLSGAATTYTAPTTPPSPTDLTVTVTAASVADPPAQGSMTITVKAISVTVTSPNATVLFGTTQPNIIAVVNDDPANQGVTWTVQCDVSPCGSISPTSTTSGAAVTYTAPTTPPASDVQVNIVATSDSDHNQQGSIQITVPAITVSISPPSGIIPVNATAALNKTPFTPTVNNDSSNQGVNWTLTQDTSTCSNACGTITKATTASGTPTTYAAPSTVPTNASVTITATSIADGTKQASTTFTLSPGTVKLIPASLGFGSLKIFFNQHPTKTLPETLTNTGSSVLNITSQTITAGTTSIPFTISTLCQGALVTNLASGGSCDISVKFAPTVVGSFGATLTIVDNDITSPQQIPLLGRGCSRSFPCLGDATIQSALAKNQVAAVPSPTGSYRIGTRVMDLMDPTRSDPYLANGTRRELLVRFWYPAAVTQACQPAQYTSPGVWNYVAKLLKVTPPQVKTNSCQDASIAKGMHPVVVFTHGYTGTFTDYTFLFEDLASRGYVVASVNHTFEATAVQFPDGRIAKSLIGNHFEHTLQLDGQSTSFAVAARLSDLKFVMDELGRMNTSPTSPFAKKLDLSRVALAGHSLGGMTALLGVEMEPRFRAALSIDGITPGRLFGPTDKPVLLLFAGRDPWDQDTCAVWRHLRGERLALNFKGSEHLTPSDAVWLANGAVQAGTMGMEKTVAATRDYIAAFLDANLRGNATDRLLKGWSPDYPDVEVTTNTQSVCGKATGRSER
jgi:predicted dienelactone hydrolase